MRPSLFPKPERSNGIELEVEKVTYDAILWERIPPQTRCICADVKGVHRREKDGTSSCGGASAQAFRTLSARLVEAVAAGEAPPVIPVCTCPGFHDADQPMTWASFATRFLGPATAPAGPIGKSRERAALTWAWKFSELDLKNPPRTFAQWMADSKRAWRVWRDVGSPITVAKRNVSFGPASIPALEDR